MLKVLFVSSEKKEKFGIYNVIKALKKNLNNYEVIYSNNLFNFFKFQPDIIHIHGCWKLHLLGFFILSKIYNKKVIISPHGMINPFSFNQKFLKKIIGWHLYQKLIFLLSNLIIVNSNVEKKNLHLKLGQNKKKIIIIPHGVNANFKYKFRKNRQNKILEFVYYSRIHPSKNLHKIIHLWKKKEISKYANLNIYGEIEDLNYFNQLKRDINYKSISYRGLIKKNYQNELSKYDVFIHPSNSENFGIVVLEALSSGLYLVLNKKLPWNHLANKGFVSFTNFNKNEILSIIKDFNNKKVSFQNIKYKKNRLNFVKKLYSWEIIVKSYYQNYNFLLKN